MRIVMDGTTQNLYTLIRGIDARWPHINVQTLQFWFPDGVAEPGNLAKSVKIGGSAMTTTLADVWDQLPEDGRKTKETTGNSLNGVSLKIHYVRGSAADTILIVEPIPG